MSDELLVDIAPDGTVYGIELLNANTQLCGGDDGALVIVNEVGAARSRSPSRASHRPPRRSSGNDPGGRLT